MINTNLGLKIKRFYPFERTAYSTVFDTPQGNVMNAHRNFYSVVMVNQPKKITTVSTK
jgi:hypothetical protein